VAAFVTLPTLIAAQTATTPIYVFTAIAAIGGPIVAYGLLVAFQWAFVAPRRRLRYALGVLEAINAQVDAQIAMIASSVVSSELRVEGGIASDYLLRLKIDVSGADVGAPLVNMIYPTAWTLVGCNQVGLFEIGSSIRSDEDLPGGQPARLWMWQAPGPFRAGVSTLLWFRVNTKPGIYEVIVRAPTSPLNDTHRIELEDDPEPIRVV
jgi:hypothetical protein